jgi:hypothetical protein
VKVVYLEAFLKCKIAIRSAPQPSKNLSVTGLERYTAVLVNVISYILEINAKNVLMKPLRTLIAPVITWPMSHHQSTYSLLTS